jgi:hypothetical protein
MRTKALPIAVAMAWLALASAADADTPALPSLAPYFQPAVGAAKAPDADGFLQRWLLLEPIVKPNRSNSGFTNSYVRTALTTQYFPGQFTAIPRDGQVVKAAQPLRWHALDSGAFDVKLFSFAKGVGKPTYGVIFWAVPVIDSPREMGGVRLSVGSNSASSCGSGEGLLQRFQPSTSGSNASSPRNKSALRASYGLTRPQSRA